MTTPLPTRFLVVSQHTGLLPWAFRLQKEGAQVELVVQSQSAERRAWRGLLRPALLGKARVPQEAWQPWLEAAQAGELAVVTDCPRTMKRFESVPHLVGKLEGPDWSFAEQPHAMVCAWFDREGYQQPWLMVPDWGVWPGGLGPGHLGGASLVQVPGLPAERWLARRGDELKAIGFRGLVQVGLRYQPVSKELEPCGWQAGWPFLATHLWLSQLPGSLSWALIAQPGEPLPTLPKRFGVALPVSLPPWPLRVNMPAAQVQLPIAREQMRSMFFHDIEVREQEVWSAGLHGLVGVATAQANSLAAARGQVVGLAASLRSVPEIQFRPDVGGTVEHWLAALEQLGYW